MKLLSPRLPLKKGWFKREFYRTDPLSIWRGMTCSVDALFNEMSWVFGGIKCRISAFSDSSVEHSLLTLVVRNLIKPRFTVNERCESNRKYRSVAVGFRLTLIMKHPSGVLLIKKSKKAFLIRKYDAVSLLFSVGMESWFYRWKQICRRHTSIRQLGDGKANRKASSVLV